MAESDRDPPSEPVDEARHAELVRKHVYGERENRTHVGRAAWFQHTSSASVGIEIVVAIAGCTLLAWWLENNYTHWSPWTTLLGFGIGLGAAVKAVVRTIKEHEREVAAREKAAVDGEPESPPLAGSDRDR